MNRKLFWKLCAYISLMTMALVFVTAKISLEVETHLSQISEENKAILKAYQREADQLVSQENDTVLYQWLDALQKKEQTFATVVALSTKERVAVPHASLDGLQVRLGRQLHWGVHLHHRNPAIELPLSDGIHYLVLRLPDHMMPGQVWPKIYFIIHLLFPLLLMMAVSYGLYYYLMKPLGKLERATRQFSSGNYEARVSPTLGGRTDELGRLATTFDEMASKVGALVKTQRHLIHDLSHELRTPLQRLELCLESENFENKARLKKETAQMRRLVEDTLTLACLEGDVSERRSEHVDLVGLIEAIADDTQFEYPDRQLHLQLPEEFEIAESNEKALSMALENIIRNAMRHTPSGRTVTVCLSPLDDVCEITVQDEGCGVPDALLELIFKPFFRVDKSRGRAQERGGFGLGLALARRQLNSIAGTVSAQNTTGSGLLVRVVLPYGE